MEVTRGRFHVNTRQNFLSLVEWRGERFSHAWCPKGTGRFFAQDAADRIYYLRS